MTILYAILYLLVGLVTSVIGKIVLNEKDPWCLAMFWLSWPFILLGACVLLGFMSLGYIPKWLAENIEKHLHKREGKEL